MLKYYCDRCGEETETIDLIRIRFSNFMNEPVHKKEVCGKCYDRILNFINHTTVEVE